MPKSVKEILVEQATFDSLKGFYNVISDIESASKKLQECKSVTDGNTSMSICLDTTALFLDSAKHAAKDCIKVGTSGSLEEAKQFEDDYEWSHYSHGLITCYINPINKRFILTKDSHNGLKNYDTIVNMTKNDLKNIIKCCEEMLADIKSQVVPDEEPKED